MKTTERKIRFGDLAIGATFFCYGDTYINYDYPKLCECVKLSHSVAQEVGGVRFLMNREDLVTIYDGQREIT